jgi:D-3-phosphoglycerate dehydrogenase / 2-oxoglutarate reductase
VTTVLITTSSFGERDNDAVTALTAANISLVLNPFGRRLTEDEAYELLSKHNPIGIVAGVEPLTERVLSAAPALKALARCGTGMDSVDVVAAEKRGIRVSRTPDAPAAAVAELTIGLIFSVLRRIAEADRTMRGGGWKSLTGGLLGAGTLGLVGYGRVGRRVASIVSPTGAKIIACDPHLTSADVPLVPLDELLKASDVVSLHSVGGSVRLGSREFAMMRKGAILINTARGDLVDESALIEALKSGHLAGAGLDVFETEPYKGPLASIDTAVLTAHMGSYAAETRAEQEREALFNLVADLKAAGALA